MEVESFTKQQMFDAMYKIVADQKVETDKALAEQRVHHDTATKSSTVSAAASPPSPKRGTAVVPPASSTARSTASPRVLSSAVPITDRNSKHDTPADDLSPGARRLYDLIVHSSSSPTSAASPCVPNNGDSHEPAPAAPTAAHALADATGLEFHDNCAASDLSIAASTRCSMECFTGNAGLFPSTATPATATMATNSTAAPISNTGKSTSTANYNAIHQLFDGAPHRHELPSDRALSIIVCRALYPVSEELLRPILAPFGVQWLVVNPRAITSTGSPYVRAIVELNSRDAAVRARVASHGKRLFDDCGYLDVRVALPFEYQMATITAAAAVASTTTPAACVMREGVHHIKVASAPVVVSHTSTMVDENSENNDTDSDTTQPVIFSPEYDDITSSVASNGVTPTLKQMVCSQMKIGAAHMQFSGRWHQAAVYRAFLCSSGYSWFLPYGSCSSLKSKESSTMSWFQFCPAGEAQLYNYGAAHTQWEIAWSTTTLAYSIHYGMFLNKNIAAVGISEQESKNYELHYALLVFEKLLAALQLNLNNIVACLKWQHNIILQYPCWNRWSALLLLLGWFLVSFLQWFWILLPVVLRYVSYNYNAFLASLNGSPAIQPILHSENVIECGLELNHWKIAWSSYLEYFDMGNQSRQFIPTFSLTYLLWYFPWDSVRVTCRSLGWNSASQFRTSLGTVSESMHIICNVCADYYHDAFLNFIGCYGRLFNFVQASFDDGDQCGCISHQEQHVQWDPGGFSRRRLGVKPKLKEGGIVSDPFPHGPVQEDGLASTGLPPTQKRQLQIEERLRRSGRRGIGGFGLASCWHLPFVVFCNHGISPFDL